MIKITSTIFSLCLITINCFPQSDSTKKTVAVVLPSVEKEATFLGGYLEWTEYIQKNLRADVPVKKGAPIGKYTIIVGFIVDVNGKIDSIKALTNLGYGMEEEVIRIIKKSPKWIPAQQNKRPVIAYCRQPVTFIVTK